MAIQENEVVTQFILFDHLEGLELFKIRKFENLENRSYTDYMALMEAVEYVSSFSLEAESDYNTELKKFLELNNVRVLHGDKALKPICKELNIEYKCSNNIMRGIKTHIEKILKIKFNKQRLLAEAYRFSRSKIGEEKNDVYAVHVGYEIEQLEKELQHITITINELKSLHPSVLTNIDQIQLVKLQSIQETKKNLINKLTQHLEDKMKGIAPNTREILGDKLLCKILHKAGGILNLSMLPASTIQLLGAEKSLFNALKSRRSTPKYGLIYELVKTKYASSPYSMGQISRDIANKCAISSKIDCFESTTNVYGVKLKQAINNKLYGKKKTKVTTEDILTKCENINQFN